MSLSTKLISRIFLGLLFSSTVLAAPDINAGKESASVCFNCHGAEGNSTNSNFPTLAGQKPAYLANQLRAFRDGQRDNAMMKNIASSLSNKDINNLAAYFASLKNKGAGGDKELAEQGKSKAPMCFGCHGNGAQGLGVAPRLAGQHPAYLQRQLRAFKEGTRKNGPMRGIAGMLSDGDIRAVTEYMGSLK